MEFMCHYTDILLYAFLFPGALNHISITYLARMFPVFLLLSHNVIVAKHYLLLRLFMSIFKTSLSQCTIPHD